MDLKDLIGKDVVIVTRHPALAELLAENGVIAKMISHASAEEVRGRVVVGNIPNHLGCEAELVVSPVIVIPEAMRGKELSLDEMRLVCHGFESYVITKVA